MSPEQLKHSKGAKPLAYRTAAVIAVSQHYNDGKPDCVKAVKTFSTLEKGIYARGMSSHVKQFLERMWNSFMTTGSVADAPRSGRPSKIPLNVALRAAELVKAGKWVWVKPKSQGIKRQVCFTSISQAIKELQELQDIITKYNATDEQLRKRMLKADDDLKFITLHMKYDHTAAEMQLREAFCKQQLEDAKHVPGGMAAFLESLIFCDEAAVTLSDNSSTKVHVWASKAAMAQNTVLHMPHLKNHKQCKIHFFIAVSGHPAFAHKNGLVYWDFTTGTTALRRYHNTAGQDVGDPFKYPVSFSAF